MTHTAKAVEAARLQLAIDAQERVANTIGMPRYKAAHASAIARDLRFQLRKLKRTSATVERTSATVERTPETYDTTANVMAYEAGELDIDAEMALFQHLVDSGLAWKLQGHYGRVAQRLIEAGVIHV